MKSELLGKQIVELFKLPKIRNKTKTYGKPYYFTAWGDKTLEGIGECLKRIMAEGANTTKYGIKGPNAWQQISIGPFNTKEEAKQFMRRHPGEYFDKQHIAKYFDNDEEKWFDFVIFEYETERPKI